MSVIITMVAAFATVIAITRWQGQSATALGKVSAVVSVTAAFAEAWSKTQVIAQKWTDNPTLVALPRVNASQPEPTTSLMPREPFREDDLPENRVIQDGRDTRVRRVPKAMTADVRDLIADLEKSGWTFTRTSKGHFRGKHPDAPKKVLILNGSSSDWRSSANARALARRLVS